MRYKNCINHKVRQISKIRRFVDVCAKEAKSRLKINKLLEEAGWRFFEKDGKPANVQFELNVKMSKKQVDDMGENFDKVTNGFVDFLLLDNKGHLFVVLDAYTTRDWNSHR